MNKNMKRTVKKKDNKATAPSLSAYMTVEATFVMIIVLAAISVCILTAFRRRDVTVAGFVNEGAASDGAYSEEIWLVDEDCIGKAEENADMQLHAIKSLEGASENIKKESDSAQAALGGNAPQVNSSCRVNDVESYMREISLLEDFIKLARGKK